MTVQSKAFDEWIDAVVDGKKPGVAAFAKSAIGDVERVSATVRYPTSRRMWPADVWAEMERIRKGEQP